MDDITNSDLSTIGVSDDLSETALAFLNELLDENADNITTAGDIEELIADALTKEQSLTTIQDYASNDGSTTPPSCSRL